MTLRSKTVLLVGGALVALIAVVSITLQVFLLHHFRGLQEQDAFEGASRALEALEAERSRLTWSVESYACWDEGYDFMVTGNRHFVDVDLPPDSQAPLVLLLDTHGRVVFERKREVSNGLELPLSQGSRRLLVDPRLRDASLAHGRSGTLLLDDGPYLVAAHPIVRSDHGGDPRGTLLIGRPIDAMLGSLAQFAHARLTLHSFFDPAPDGDTAWAWNALSGSARSAIRPSGPDDVVGFARNDDVFGRPALLFRVDSPRHILKEGRASVGYLIGALLLVGLAFGGVTLYLIESLVLACLARFSADVGAIASSADFTARVRISGSDELARLAEDVNGMLRALEESRRGLHESQEKLRDVVENSTNLFYANGPDLSITYVSPQTREFLDCEPEAAPKNWRLLLSDDECNRQGLAAKRRAIDSGVRQPVYEAELVTLRGRRIAVEVNEAPVVRDGRVVAVVGALTDVTARKNAEREHARLEEQLRQSQKMEAIGRLAGGVAHDFNNLLNVILGYGDLLARRLPADSPLQRNMVEIRKAGERGANLTRQLLAFSRKQVLQPRVLDLNVVVSDTETMLKRLVGEDVELRTALGPDLGYVKADPGQIEQMIMNLVVNARDAMLGGGTLSLETGNVHLDEEHARRHDCQSGPHAMLAVSDTGHGMDGETQARIFEPFFTTKAEGKGTGLGLATVYGIVEQSGGHIDVWSEVGRGTSFRIYLPLVESAAPAAAADTRPLPTGTETVLLVEDEEALRALTREILVEAGYQVLDSGSPDEAIALAASCGKRIDLLLTDVILPRMSGSQLAARLHAVHPIHATVYMSGYTADAIGRHGVLDPGVHFLQKPVTPEALLAKLRDALERGSS